MHNKTTKPAGGCGCGCSGGSKPAKSKPVDTSKMAPGIAKSGECGIKVK